MRLIVHGQQAFGEAVLKRLLERGENVVAVYCAPDRGTRPDVLKQAAENAGIEVFQPASYKTPDVAAQMDQLNADLCLMAYVTLFVPSTVLNTPKLGSIQYHPSLLPDHKGPSSINWPIIQGKTKTGLSIFWPDDGLDTGPILLQKTVDIAPDDTLGSLYFNHLFPMGVDAMLESLDMVRNGTAPRMPQDPDAGSYESWCGKKEAEIDWNHHVDDVYNLIRGTNPQPGAWTTLDGETVQIFDCEKHPSTTDHPPGHITEIGESAFCIAAQGGEIHVQRVRAGGQKVSATQFAQDSSLKAGIRFGS